MSSSSSVAETEPPTDFTSADELEELTSKVSSLLNLSIEVIKLATEVQHRLPLIMARQAREMSEQIAAQVAAALPPPGSSLYSYTKGVAITPDALEAAHANSTEHIKYHVVTIGGDPGIYTSITESDHRVLGYPSCDRRRKDTRTKALTYYRVQYEAGNVLRWHRHLLPPSEDAEDSD
ncbi:hypothetical protein C8J57DRAFT_1719329 [Mycena rebaudengoi]|nr:hypothetical protein C8J57DRAFT_1719329 [Mycena rebaudengoi]